MSNEIRDQFVRDMQVAGLSEGTQRQYASAVRRFIERTWLGPQSVTERDVQSFLISLRDQGVARETFRGYRYALEFLFTNTLGRDWALFKKNFERRHTNACLGRCRMSSA